jgi:hypothetical protein
MYATPTIKPIAMTAEAASCCRVDVVLYSPSLGINLYFNNVACGTALTQFPTCGSISSPLLDRASGSALAPSLNAPAASGALHEVKDAGTGAGVAPIAIPALPRSIEFPLPVDVCTVSITQSGNFAGQSMAAALVASG